MGRLAMMAGGTNISEVVDMEAVRAAVLSCQRFTALYLCSAKLCVCVCEGLGWSVQLGVIVALKQYSPVDYFNSSSCFTPRGVQVHSVFLVYLNFNSHNNVRRFYNC